MRTAIFALLFLAAAPSLASDGLRDEVVCLRAHASGVVDPSFSLVLRGNETAWMKAVVIFENGYVGSRQIAQVAVPLSPEIRPRGRGETDLVYRGAGVNLSLRSRGSRLTGQGSVELTLPGKEILRIPLSCRS